MSRRGDRNEMVIQFEARLMRKSVNACGIGDQVKLQIRMVATAFGHGPQYLPRQNDGRFAAEFNHFLDGVWIPRTQVLDDNISALAGILGHRFESLRRRLVLMPVERAFFPQIEVPDQKDGDVYHHFREAVHPDARRHLDQVAVDVRPWIQKNGFHVEKYENHRHQIKSYGDWRARISRGLHAAFVGLLLSAARASPAHQHRGSRQRPGKRRGNQQV